MSGPLLSTNLGILLVTLAGSASLLSAQAPERLTFREVMEVPRQVGPISVTPSGDAMAYLTQTVNWDANRYDFALWIAPYRGDPRRIAEAVGLSFSAVQWAPDGQRVAFLASGEGGRQIYVAPRDGDPIRLTAVPEGVGDFRWSPDGTRIAFLRTDLTGTTATEERETVDLEVVSVRSSPPQHLWLLEIPEIDSTPADPQAARRLTSGSDLSVRFFTWSPDGAHIAFDHRPTDPDAWWEVDISVLEIGSGSIRPVVTQPGPDWVPLWSPDGRSLLFSTKARGADWHRFHDWKLARVPAGGGERELLAEGIGESPSAAAWTSRGIVFSAARGTQRPLFLLEVDHDSLAQVGGFSNGAIDFFETTADGETIYFTAHRSDRLKEVYRTALDSFQPERVTRFTEYVDGWPLGTREVISWRSFDGVEIEGVLYMPEDFDPSARKPLLVILHGGPIQTARPGLLPSPIAAWWLSRGGVVLEPNFRGSTGYGERFRSLNVGCLYICESQDVLTGVDELVRRGIADPLRMAAAGWSHGGSLAAFLATRSRRFQAISVGAGAVDQQVSYAVSDNQDFYVSYLGGTPWEEPERYAEVSAITTVGESCTPTIIQHGSSDRRIPPANAWLLYRGLRDSGVPTRLLVYDGGHGPAPREDLALLRHMRDWFDRYVWDSEPADRSVLPERCRSDAEPGPGRSNG